MALHTLSAARSRGDALLLSRRHRARIEALIERLIATLDAADGDPDVEPEPREDDDAEASLQPLVTPDSTRPTRGIAQVTP